MGLFSKLTAGAEKRKADTAIRNYEEKRTDILALLTEIEMLEKMEGNEGVLERKRQAMKERLVALERRRKELKGILTAYIGKFPDKDTARYEAVLAALDEDAVS